MTKLLRALALSAAMVGVTTFAMSISPAPAPAQGKKDEKKTTQAVKGAIEIYKDKKDQYRFRINGADDKAIAICTKGYEKKEDCEKALASLKEIINNVKPTEVKANDK